ncbi:MAG: hypothetical protein V1824_03130 [archaeon]
MNEIIIELKNNSKTEILAKETLLEILEEYNLEKWIFTNKVVFEDDCKSHSHPIITLNTFCNNKKLQLMSVFLHEQIHWFEAGKEKEVKSAINELKEKYPDIEIISLQNITKQKAIFSTDLHIIVNYLEYDVLCQIIGKEKAIKIINLRPHYKWIYSLVLKEEKTIREILENNGLII